jgi:hypothetical protein
MVCFRKLGLIWATMWIMTIMACHLCTEVFALKEVNPLLMMLPRMRFRISPNTGFLLVVIVERFTEFVGFIIFIVPWKIETSAGNTYAT